MHDFIEILKALGPIISGSAWPLAIFFLLLIFKNEIKKGCGVFFQQFPRLSNAEVAGWKIQLSPPPDVKAIPDVGRLEVIELQQVPSILTEEGQRKIFEDHRGVFLTHIIDHCNPQTIQLSG